MVSLIIFTLSVYGIAWIFTKSYLFHSLRNYITEKELTYLAKLFSCIVCMSVWVSVALLMLLEPHTTLHFYHYVIVSGYAAGSTWIIASLIGDAS